MVAAIGPVADRARFAANRADRLPGQVACEPVLVAETVPAAGGNLRVVVAEGSPADRAGAAARRAADLPAALAGAQLARRPFARWAGHSQLQHACPTCSTMVRNEWAICVTCGTPQRGAAARLIPEPALVQPVLSHAPAAPSTLGQPQLGQPQTSLPYGAEIEQPPLRRSQRNPFARETGAPPEDLDDLYRSARPGEG